MSESHGILVVSFGTSVPETRVRTLEAIETRIANSNPDFPIYRAWTSSVLRKKVFESEHLAIDSVSDALSRMKLEGIRHAVIQPTFVVNGVENEQLKLEAAKFADDFDSIRFGKPLLSDDSDIEAVASAVIEEFSDVSTDTLVILMGHGAGKAENKSHSAGPLPESAAAKNDSPDPQMLYQKLDAAFSRLGATNIALRTMDSPTAVTELLAIAAKYGAKQILLAPFLIVAGKHAQRDMAGSEKTSWKSQFEEAGFPVICLLKGLGEYKSIQDIFAEHAAKAI